MPVFVLYFFPWKFRCISDGKDNGFCQHGAWENIPFSLFCVPPCNLRDFPVIKKHKDTLQSRYPRGTAIVVSFLD